MNPTSVTTLDALGAIHVAGRDAIPFLQGQLTADVTHLAAAGAARLAAYNTPQGRVIALLRLVPYADGVLALLPRALAQPVVDRLRRYVLRSKVVLRVADELAFAGLPARADAVAAGPAKPLPEGAVLVRFLGRDVLAAPRDALAAALAADGRATLAPESWRAAGIAAGDPEVEPPATEEWVAQMLNLDLLDAISFTKGCYTGQEIVARTQHLGRIKRRTFRYRTRGGLPTPKDALLLDGAKVGEVVTSAPVGDAVELLAVVGLEARDRTLATSDGAACEPLPLPYAIP